MTPRPALRAGLRILILSAVFGSTLTGFTARVFAATAPSPSPSPGGLRTIIRVRAKANRASRSRRQQFLSPFSGSVIGRDVIKHAGPISSIQSILNSSPSVEAFSFGGSGLVRTHLSFRGFNGGQFGETLDGIPLNGLFNGGVTNSASQRNATAFVTPLVESVNVYRGVNDPEHTSIDSLGGSVAYHLLDPAFKRSFGMVYNAGSGGDAIFNTGANAAGVRAVIGTGTGYYRGFQNDVPDWNHYIYGNLIVPVFHRTGFLRFIYNDDRNNGYVPHDVPNDAIPGASIATNGIAFQWPVNQTYSYNIAHTNLDLIDFVKQWSPEVATRLTFFRYLTDYSRTSYTDPTISYLPNSPFAPTFAQGWMNGTISSNAADFAYHLYHNSDQRLGFVARSTFYTSDKNTLKFGWQYVHGHEESAEYWGPTLGFAPQLTYNDAWDQPGNRNSIVQYAEDTYRAGKLLVEPGLRFDSVTTESITPFVGYFYSQTFSVGNSYAFFEPSLGLRYRFAKNLVAYMGTGTAYKPPEISAYYNDVIDSVTGKVAPLVVQPEQSTDFDLGLRGNTEGYRWSAGIYRDNFNNTFSQAPAPLSYYENALGQTPAQAAASVASGAITLITNAGNSRYSGVELGISHVRLTPGRGDDGLFGFVNASQNAAYYTTAYTSGSNSHVNAGTNVPYVPNHLYNIGASFVAPHFSGYADYRIVGAQTIFDNVTAAPSMTQLRSYRTLDANITWEPARDKGFGITLSGYNLLDERANVYEYNSSSFAAFPNGVFVGMPMAPPTVVVSFGYRS